MTPYKQRLNPFIRRMAEDMQLRNLSASTIDAYTYHVDKFCCYFGKRPKKLPTVLSDQEASGLLQCVKHPKHRSVLLTCYAAGLRLAEATHLRVAHIDGQRAQIRITNAKGGKERVVPVSPRLLRELREYWKLQRPGNYLFPGKTADVPLSATTVQKACKLAVAKACTDRHCPQCSGARRADWLEKTRELLLPGGNYFQVVFTLPDRFSPLILGNRRELYDLLFCSAWQSLDEVLRQEGKFHPASLMVLHT